jgi:hypothetical protein
LQDVIVLSTTVCAAVCVLCRGVACVLHVMLHARGKRGQAATRAHVRVIWLVAVPVVLVPAGHLSSLPQPV